VRQWLLLRRRLIDPAQSGRGLKRACFWPIDTGNYHLSRASAYAGTALAAVEMGDVEIARLCLDALDEECPSKIAESVCYRPSVSVWTHAVEFFARGGRRNGFRDLIEHPRAAAARPMLDPVPYPQVLVARACHAEGMLAATLYPGEGGGRFHLGLRGLAPGGTYVCEGTQEQRILADERGAGMIAVGIDRRTEIRIRRAI
jgi:hypothetical protein